MSAMIFVPTTETGYATATSYLSVAEADELVTAQQDSGEWSEMATA